MDEIYTLEQAEDDISDLRGQLSQVGEMVYYDSDNQAVLVYAVSTARGPTAYGFESGTDSWAGDVNCSVSQSSAWASVGTYSLLVTSAATGAFDAAGPMIACVAGDPVSVSADCYVPSARTGVYIGIQWYEDDETTLISETDSTVDGTYDSFASGQQKTLTVSDTAPDGATYFRVVYGCSNATYGASTNDYIDNILVSGNLAVAISPDGGTDDVGNTFEQGVHIVGVDGQTNVVSVDDPFGNTLASIDAAGDITGQTVYAADDVYAAGESLLNSIVPGLAAGSIARSYIPNSSLNYPSAGVSSETSIYELDVNLTGGRSYQILLENTQYVLSGPGRLHVLVRATTDGTTPTTSSPVFMAAYLDLIPSNRTSITVPAMSRFYQPSVDTTMKLLLTIATSNDTVAGTAYAQPTVQIQSFASSPFTEGQAGLTVIDQGVSVPNTGTLVGSSGQQNYTKTYTATHTYSYQGSDAGDSLIDTDGKAYQGGNVADTYNGKSKTWILFDHATIASDLSGATINSVKLTLNNNHSWYNSGMTVCVGWDTKSSFGSTASDPSSHIDLKEFSVTEGATQTFNIGTAFGTAFQSSGATTIVLFKNSNSLTYYGYFAGSVNLTV